MTKIKINQTLNLLKFKIICYLSCLFCSIHRLSVYLHLRMSTLKTTIIQQNIKIILIAGVPSSQALSGFLITAPPSVCVSAVLVSLAVWIQNPKKKCPVRFPSFRGFRYGQQFCSDVRTLSDGQGLGCPWGVVTPTKKNISVPFQLEQKRA